jgi:N-acetyl sugar amidotransferase
MELRLCTKCVLPETHETISFDTDGVCSICRGQEIKSTLNWDKKLNELHELISSIPSGSDYDCLIPFSGGKDSTWTLWYVVEKLKLKPLVVSFDHSFFRPGLIENRERVLKKLGVDFLSFTPSWKVVRSLMLQSFLEKGDFCWHCHTGIFSYPMWVAIEKQIPLILWGEPSSEYASYYSYNDKEEVDETRFNRFVNLGINAQDMYERLSTQIELRDLKPFTYPSKEALVSAGIKSVPLGSYIPWDVKKQVAVIQQELGWIGDEVEGVPVAYNYEKVECYMQGVRDYIKYLKRGYSRVSHLTSIDIRNNLISREEALKLITEYEGKKPASLYLFLEYINMTEEEFVEVVATHAISPWEAPSLLQIGKKPKDFETWPHRSGVEKKEQVLAFNNWLNEK